jgi:hypothetical protein
MADVCGLYVANGRPAHTTGTAWKLQSRDEFYFNPSLRTKVDLALCEPPQIPASMDTFLSLKGFVLLTSRSEPVCRPASSNNGFEGVKEMAPQHHRKIEPRSRKLTACAQIAAAIPPPGSKKRAGIFRTRSHHHSDHRRCDNRRSVWGGSGRT